MVKNDGYFSLEEIRECNDRRYKDIVVTFGGKTAKLKIQNLLGDEFLTATLKSTEPVGTSGDTRIVPALLHRAVVIAGVAQPPLDDQAMEWLGKKSAGTITDIFNEIYALSGMLTVREMQSLGKSGGEGNPSLPPPSEG